LTCLESLKSILEKGSQEATNLVRKIYLILIENNWRRRIYDALNVLQNSEAVNMDSKTITLPDDKKKLVGLLITKEELFKDLFIKKKLLQEKKLTLHSKGYELGFLKGIVDGRKALKKNLIRDDTNTLTNVTYLEGSMITKQAKVSEDSHDIKIVTSVPRLFRIPFYLVSIP
jgi:hypothetical protein